jgi:uncharacterized protein YeaO (DUF488 family)
VAHSCEPKANPSRVLVDRIWPRGLTKAKAALDEWCKDVAPSGELREWYHHDPGRFEDFGHRYQAELQDPQRAAGGLLMARVHLVRYARDASLKMLGRRKRDGAPPLHHAGIAIVPLPQFVTADNSPESTRVLYVLRRNPLSPGR